MADTLPSRTTVTSTATPGAFAPHYRFPANLTQPPVDKWMLFEVKSGRHVQRHGMVVDARGSDRTIASVGLYLPDSAVGSAIGVKYDDATALGIWGGQIATWFGQTQSALTQLTQPAGSDEAHGLSKVLGKTLEDSGGIWGMLKTIGAMGTTSILQGSEGKLGAVSKSIFGSTPNPRTDVLFEACGYRKHDYTFTLIPRNVGEAQAIDHIIHLFQFYMLPSYLDKTEFMMGFPYEFETTFLDGNSNELTHVGRVGRSVLTDCVVDHAAGKRTAFIKHDGEYYPVASTIQLKFQEVRLLARDSREIDRANLTKDSLEESGSLVDALSTGLQTVASATKNLIVGPIK